MENQRKKEESEPRGGKMKQNEKNKEEDLKAEEASAGEGAAEEELPDTEIIEEDEIAPVIEEEVEEFP